MLPRQSLPQTGGSDVTDKASYNPENISNILYPFSFYVLVSVRLEFSVFLVRLSVNVDECFEEIASESK